MNNQPTLFFCRYINHIYTSASLRPLSCFFYASALFLMHAISPFSIILYLHHHHHWLDSPTWALAFLRRFCQLKYPAIASSDFVTRVFSRVVLSAPRPTPGYRGGPMLSVRVVFLSWLVPILKCQDLAFCPCMDHTYKRCPGAMTWTCMQRNKWHYSSFVSIHLSARCVPSPRTARRSWVG
jgi:hypothetical protein